MNELTQKLINKLSDRNFRLDNLYVILPEVAIDGKTIIPFKMRDTQRDFVNELHNRILVNKSRKQGFSTLLAIMVLDATIFNKNHSSVIIDYKEKAAFDKLLMCKNAWELSEEHIDNIAIKEIWKGIKERIQLVSSSKSEMVFSNGSVIRAGTAVPGGTNTVTWISELGPISQEAPHRALQIKRSVLSSVPRDGYLIIESTTRSSIGLWADLLGIAAENTSKTVLDPMEYKLFFRGWTHHPTCRIEQPHEADIDPFLKDYFQKLEEEYNIKTDFNQRVWYARKFKEIGDEIYHEFPSHHEESLKSTTSGQIYPQILTVKTSGRICKLTFEADYPLYAVFDLGISDATTGVLFQMAGRDILIHRSFSTTGEGAGKVANLINEWEREFKTRLSAIFLPHDANRRDIGGAKTYVSYLRDAGIPMSQITVLPRCSTIWSGIRTLRSLFPRIWFDSSCNDRFKGLDGEALPSLIQSLENYKRHPTSGEPLHDETSHFADAMRYMAEATEHGYIRSVDGNSRSTRRFRPSTQAPVSVGY